MANEELNQRGYLESGRLKGSPFGIFEHFSLGSTTTKELVSCGLKAIIPSRVDFPFVVFKRTKNPDRCMPDQVYCQRIKGKLLPVFISEHKQPNKFNSDKKRLEACEQALFSAASLGLKVASATDGTTFIYIDVDASLANQGLSYINEPRTFNPAVLENLLAGDAGEVRDPRPLAESVWQIIWHATKAEPKECLLTFVEIFVLKFLSDNLPSSQLPKSQSFYELNIDPALFMSNHGKTAIEYYVEAIRPKIKSLFPDNTVADEPKIASMFGLSTVVSKTSIINGFAFLRSSTTSLVTFNRTFLEILNAFQKFGPLTNIDPQFKLRLYETFLRRSARQQKLGQFFTPRNIVKSMITMADLASLNNGSVVLDPAAGVGGFVLEPLIFDSSLRQNITFKAGKPEFKVHLIGVDVDNDIHILAKANMLIHLAEELRNPSTTLSALNLAMADTFVQMNENETLGALLQPPTNAVDVILTNPPYVTKGSGIYGKEIADLEGVIKNGVDLREHYDGVGLGLEAFFLRYITKALKPGGRAFIIVPLGMLNRTEPGPKEKILADCNILASIALPRNAFFNTSQKTYILAIEKRHSVADPRPDVFCAIARSIGETLDYRRIVTPEDNDLAEIAEAFVEYTKGVGSTLACRPNIKAVSASCFSSNDRWDVNRFWSDSELVDLGERTQTIDRDEFIEQAEESLSELNRELEDARKELRRLSKCPMQTVQLSDEGMFDIRSGTRIRDVDIRANAGDVPVYSCFKNEKITKGYISEDYLNGAGILIEGAPIVTVNANGASVGKVYFRDEKCVITDDVIAVAPLSSDIDTHYLATELRRVVAAGGFLYEAKLFKARVKELSVDIPVTANGDFDLKQQKAISDATTRFNTVVSKIVELGDWASEARIA